MRSRQSLLAGPPGSWWVIPLCAKQSMSVNRILGSCVQAQVQLVVLGVLNIVSRISGRALNSVGPKYTRDSLQLANVASRTR